MQLHPLRGAAGNNINSDRGGKKKRRRLRKMVGELCLRQVGITKYSGSS